MAQQHIEADYFKLLFAQICQLNSVSPSLRKAESEKWQKSKINRVKNKALFHKSQSTNICSHLHTTTRKLLRQVIVCESLLSDFWTIVYNFLVTNVLLFTVQSIRNNTSNKCREVSLCRELYQHTHIYWVTRNDLLRYFSVSLHVVCFLSANLTIFHQASLKERPSSTTRGFLFLFFSF